MPELPDDPKAYNYMGKPLVELSKEELLNVVVFLLKQTQEIRQDIFKLIELRGITRNSETREYIKDKIARENPKDFP